MKKPETSGVSFSEPLTRLDSQVTRRSIVIGIAALLAGCRRHEQPPKTTIPSGSDAGAEETPRKHRIGRLLDTLRERGFIQNTSVHHPDGAADSTPRNPVVFIEDFHAGQGKRGIAEEGVRFSFYKYQLLLALHDAGMRRFRCEGHSADSSVPPYKVRMSDGRIASPEQVRWTFEQQKYFRPWAEDSQHRGVALPVEELFAASVGDDTVVKGTENPVTLEAHETSSRTLRHMREEMGIFFEAMRECMDVRGNFPYEYPFRGDSDAILIGRHVFAADPLRENLHAYEDQHYSMSDGEQTQERERYIAERLPDAEVLVFGAHHAKRLKNALPKHGRSVYVVEPTGLPPHHLPWDAHAVESVLLVLQERVKTAGENNVQ